MGLLLHLLLLLRAQFVYLLAVTLRQLFSLLLVHGSQVGRLTGKIIAHLLDLGGQHLGLGTVPLTVGSGLRTLLA